MSVCLCIMYVYGILQINLKAWSAMACLDSSKNLV